MTFKVVIPARYGSTRLPAKPLALINGKPMVIRVAQQAAKSDASEVIIATDHTDIFDAAIQHGFRAVMTSDQHQTGTDRIAEVVKTLEWDDNEIVVNVQGDEPLIDPQIINETALNLAEYPLASIATACHPILNNITLHSPNHVKVVMDKNGYALYFSRAAIPYPRGAITEEVTGYSHVGIYAYRVKFLKDYHLLEHSKIEGIESLEQLRTLWNGHKISVFVSDKVASIGVDTQADLDLVRKILR
jgi:3-deoxy-manno-octulosonate cytidylyltransferase (CMP-KDO synthetase)